MVLWKTCRLSVNGVLLTVAPKLEVRTESPNAKIKRRQLTGYRRKSDGFSTQTGWAQRTVKTRFARTINEIVTGMGGSLLLLFWKETSNR